MDTQQTAEPEAITVNQILDRYQRDCLHDLAPRTRADYKRHIPTLRKWFGERIASELKPRDFHDFMDIPGRGKQQRNKQLAILSSAFTNAVSRWYILDTNIVRGVYRHPSKPRDRLYTDEEFAGIRALAPLRIQLAMDLALITGQRQGDILSMRWSDVKDGALHIHQHKTGKRLAIELSGDLKRVLGKCWKLQDNFLVKSDNIIVNERNRPYTSDGFRSCWQRNMREWVKRGGTRGSFHDIRALCATRCPTIEYAMYLLGHSNIAMTRRVYRRGVERVKPLELPSASPNRKGTRRADRLPAEGGASPLAAA